MSVHVHQYQDINFLYYEMLTLRSCTVDRHCQNQGNEADKNGVHFCLSVVVFCKKYGKFSYHRIRIVRLFTAAPRYLYRSRDSCLVSASKE